MIAVGLDGRPISVKRRRVRSPLSASNVNQDDPTLMVCEQEDEWAAFDQLPRSVREYLSDVMPIDQSACAVLGQWHHAKQRGATPGDFVRYLEAMSLAYLNATASTWPTPPPLLVKVPR